MEHEKRHTPLPEQGQQAQPDSFVGWEYAGNGSQPPRPMRQFHSGAGLSPASLPGITDLPTHSQPSLSGSLVETPATQPSQPGVQPVSHMSQPDRQSADYQAIPDMGTSLKYGQSMEYQYFDAPQPSQPIARIREDRLQRLREERLRRRYPDVPHATGPATVNTNALFSGVTKWSRKIASSIVQPTIRTLQNRPVSSASPDEPAALDQMRPVQGVIPDALLSDVPDPSSNGVSGVPIPVTPDIGASDVVPLPKKHDTGALRVQLGKAALILTGAFIASRILGLVRTSLFAFVFGTSSTSDAYLQAFLVPELIFNLVTGGALLSAFIPVFTHYTTAENDERSAWHLTSTVLNLALVVMGVLSLLAMLAAPALVPLYNPGVRNQEHLALITTLTRIMLLQAIALGAGAVVTSVLNARQSFRLPAIGTVLYNVGLILGLLPGMIFTLTGQHNDAIAIYAATWGVVLGALLQVGIQVPGLVRAGMRYSPSFDWRHPGVIQIARHMLPRTLNASMLYISIFVDRGLIQLLILMLGLASVDGLITQYYQAFQLVLLPLGIFGMSMSTAAFPTLAEYVARGRMDRVRSTILSTLRSILFLSIPSTIGLIVLGLPIVQVVLQHGRYSLAEAQSTTIPLACFAVGLTGMASVEILSRSFYALRDSVTPVVVSVGQFAVKIVLGLLLINIAVLWGPSWGLGALALATAIAGLLEASILLYLLQKRTGSMQVRTLGLFILRVLVAALAMGLSLFIIRFVLDMFLVTTDRQTLGVGGELLALLKLGIELPIGLFIYIRAARFLNIEELAPLKRILDRLHLSWI